MQKALYVGV